MLSKIILFLPFFFITCSASVHAGIFKDIGEGYSKIAEVNHNIEWGFVMMATSLLVAMFGSFGKVAGKFKSKILLYPVAIAYSLGILTCIILLVVQFESWFSAVFEFLLILVESILEILWN
jgi:hypothetical protein